MQHSVRARQPSRGARTRVARWWGIAVVCLVGSAQAGPPAPTLHEPPPAIGVRGRSDRAVAGNDRSGLPAAIDTSSGRIEAPPPRGVGERDGDGAPLYPAPPAPGTTPPPKIRPDASTGKEGALHYRVVFDPSVAPFKRDLAFDRPNADGSLGLSGEGTRRVAARRSQPRPGHELFWGHVTLELVPGRATPLPSVAPSSSVLGMQADPPLPIVVQRDGAGNFNVTLSRESGQDTPRRVELRFLMDAPSTYFAAPLGSGPSVDDPPAPKLDTPLQARISALWGEVGVSPQHDRKRNLEALTAWFRGFVPGPGPSPGPELVTELIRRRRGICRHRAHGFVLVAWSLGIPAHYVMNDAHAFVEVWARGEDGKGHWLRIDLGGGADSLELHGADNHHLHRPLFADPLPRPASYLQEGGQRLGEASGGAGMAGAQKVIGAEAFRNGDRKAGPAAGNGADGSPGVAVPTRGDTRDREWLERRAMELAAPRRPPGDGPGGRDGSATGPAGDGRLQTALTLRKTAAVAYIGEIFVVAGALSATGPARLGGLPIEVWLVDPRNRANGQRIGHAITGADGRFRAEVAMPLDARLGDWDLVVRFAGDRALMPSYSRDGGAP
ncbi:MAG: hypothetical protein RIT45_1723 [Pseudomonadota bacterium]